MSELGCTRRALLKAVGAGAATAALPSWLAASDASMNRPNIILIVADDQAPKTLGFDGNPVIRTPNIDRLAHEGVFFSRAYVPIPQCAPSRAALLTGTYPHENGIVSNKVKGLPKGMPTFAQVLKDHGYHCGLVGKWQLGNTPQPQGGFEDYWVVYDRKSTSPSQKFRRPWILANGKPKQHKGYLTDILTDYAIRFTDESKDGPFLLCLMYHAPHAPHVKHPDPSLHYDPRRIPLPESIRDDLSDKPVQQRRGLTHLTFRQISREQLREHIARYYSMISAVDANVGRLVNHLKAQGLDRNTLVIYASDNGWLGGEHQMVDKGAVMYEELVRMPVVFWWPGRVPANRRLDALVSTLDIYPTITALAGEPKPPQLAGEDLWPLIDGKVESVRETLFLQYHERARSREVTPMLGVVTPRYKLIRYLIEGDEELYDLQSDPHELNNLIKVPAYSEVRGQLRRQMNQFSRSTQSPFSENKP